MRQVRADRTEGVAAPATARPGGSVGAPVATGRASSRTTSTPAAAVRVARRILRLVRPALAGAALTRTGATFRSSEEAGTAALRGLLARTCQALEIEIEVTGTPPAAPGLLVSNHVSFLDPLIVGSLVQVRPIAMSELSSWPFLGRICCSTGVLFVTRGDASSGARIVRAAVRSLRDGILVLAFPEGTTTHGDRVLPFRRGMFAAASIAKVPSVPIAIRYESPECAWVGGESFLPRFVRICSLDRIRVRVHFGAPIAHQPSVAPAELAARAGRAISSLLADIG